MPKRRRGLKSVLGESVGWRTEPPHLATAFLTVSPSPGRAAQGFSPLMAALTHPASSIFWHQKACQCVSGDSSVCVSVWFHQSGCLTSQVGQSPQSHWLRCSFLPLICLTIIDRLPKPWGSVSSSDTMRRGKQLAVRFCWELSSPAWGPAFHSSPLSPAFLCNFETPSLQTCSWSESRGFRLNPCCHIRQNGAELRRPKSKVWTTVALLYRARCLKFVFPQACVQCLCGLTCQFYDPEMMVF